MKRLLAAFAVAIVAISSSLTSYDAEAARRLGGGKSFGMQRDGSVVNRSATPPSQTAPTSPSAAQSPQTAPATPATQPRRSWMGPIAGLAAGLGIAALLSHFGLGEGMATLVTLLLVGLLVFVAIGFVTRMLRRPGATATPREPLRYAGADAVAQDRVEPQFRLHDPVPGIAPALNHANVSTPFDRPPGAPADFDVEGFERNAKLNFVRLQAAFDGGNAEDLRQFTTPEVFAELKLQLEERGAAPQQTDIIVLKANVLDVTTEPTRYIVSVRFSGMLREESNAAPEPFEEVWHLTKPIDGHGGWVVAGIQQLQAA